MTTTLKVAGMNCSKCVSHVTEALEEVPGVSSASVDLEFGRAEVEHGGLDPLLLIAAIEDAGYSADVEQ